jgi:phasin family protein
MDNVEPFQPKSKGQKAKEQKAREQKAREQKATEQKAKEQTAQEPSGAAVAPASSVAASAQAIAVAHADYTRKALRDNSEFIKKLASLKTPSDVMALHGEYAKITYEGFAAEAKKISELYADLAKQAFQPLEGLVAKMIASQKQK